MATTSITAFGPLRRRLAGAGQARIWALVAGTAGAAAVSYATRVGDYRAPSTATVHLPWWVFALFFCITEGFVLHLHFRSEAHSLSLSEFGLVLGLFFASAPTLLTGQLVGAFFGLVLLRRQRPTKVAFNLAQFALTTSFAIVIFRGLGDGAAGVRDWAAALIAALAACALGILLVGAAIRLAQGDLTVPLLTRASAVSLTGTAVNASLALIAVAMLPTHPTAIALLAVPLIALVLAYRAYNDHRRQYEHLEFLYESMRSIQGEDDLAGAIRQVLASAQRLVCAEHAEVILLVDGGDRVLRSVLNRQGEALLEKSRLTPYEHRALDLLAEKGRAVLLGRRHEPTIVDGYLAERGLEEAVLTALHGEDRTIGLMVIGDRAGEVVTFTRHDAKLCDTFAAHVSLTLENDLLEKSILDLTELKEQLKHQAFHDALTGLPNRAMLTERIAGALKDGTPATVLFLDLDDFKTINDSLGHASGDELLRIVARRVADTVRAEDTPARIGGDEFAVLMTGGETHDAERLAARLVEAVNEPMMLRGRQVSLHTSVGIAPADSANDADELLQNADLAMYAAKSRGKRSHLVYEPAMHELVRHRHALSSALEHAVERDEILVHYQPIVDLRTGRLVAFEALARWLHPDRGMIQPGEFVPIAVEAGVMPSIGRSVLQQACRQAAGWRGDPRSEQVTVMVNLTASELENPLLVDQIATALRDSRLPPDALSLEITETGVMLEPEATIERLERLRALGVRLALDDFGTGYSSLSHLSRFPIDLVKIPKEFIDRLDDRAGRAFVDTIIRLADALGIETVAEGIEEPSQAVILEQLSCHFGQGFHFARPLDPGDVERFLTEQPTLVVA